MKTSYVALTTIDNPYDPFDEFNKWFVYDVTKGYNSCGYLARIAKTSEQLTEQENLKLIEDAIDEIVKLNPKLYKKVKQNE